jgi:hypothetical protein
LSSGSPNLRSSTHLDSGFADYLSVNDSNPAPGHFESSSRPTASNMMARLIVGFLRTAAFAPLGPSISAQGRPEFRVPRVAPPPKIDGVLNNAAWNGDPLNLGLGISYNPLRGETGPEQTEVHVAYDRFIYFAFLLSLVSLKTPGRFGRRSAAHNAFSDDWVGLSLDSIGTGQSAYHLMVNPNGIQMDTVNTTSAGERFESDFVVVERGPTHRRWLRSRDCPAAADDPLFRALMT